MKKLTTKYLFLSLLLAVSVSFVSCSSSDDDDDNNNGTPNENAIAMKFTANSIEYTYTLNPDNLTDISLGDGNVVNLNYALSSATASSGIYNGAKIACSYYLDGEGTYELVAPNDFSIARDNKKVMYVHVTVGTSTLGTSLERTATYQIEGTTATVKVVDGKYSITINEGSGKWIYSLNEGDGESESFPESISSFSMNDIYNYIK